MAKRRYDTISKRKKNLTPIIIIIAAALVIIMIGVGSVMYMASASVSQSINSKEVAAICSVSGNDIIVQIFDSKRADDVISIEIAIDGYNIPPGLSVKSIPLDDDYPKMIVYEGFLAGTYKDIMVSIRAAFNDGSSSIVWMESLRVT